MKERVCLRSEIYDNKIVRGYLRNVFRYDYDYCDEWWAVFTPSDGDETCVVPISDIVYIDDYEKAKKIVMEEIGGTETNG